MPSADYKAVRRPRFAELNWSRAERPELDLAQPVDSKFARLSATHEGRTLHAFGHAIVVLLDGKQTGKKFTGFLNITPPGGDPGAATMTTKTNGSMSSKVGLVFS